MDETLRQRLLDILLRQSVIRKRVTLASGRESDFYVDCRMTSLSGAGVVLSAQLMYPLMSDCDLVGGMTMGADPFLGAILYEASRAGRAMDAFIVRKEAKGHGMQKRVEGPVRSGARAAVIEDVVTSGGSMLQAVDAAREAGLTVVRAVCLFDRGEGGREALKARGLDLAALFSMQDLEAAGIRPEAR